MDNTVCSAQILSIYSEYVTIIWHALTTCETLVWEFSYGLLAELSTPKQLSVLGAGKQSPQLGTVQEGSPICGVLWFC